MKTTINKDKDRESAGRPRWVAGPGRRLALWVLALGFQLALATAALAQVNHPPVADAGPDQSLYLGDIAILHATATDPDGDAIVAWEWSMTFKPEGSEATLYYADSPDPFFDTDMVGQYIVTLQVSDGKAASATDAVIVMVASNLPPEAVLVADVTSGVWPLVVHFDGTGSSDPEGAALSYAWSFGDGIVGVTDPTPVHEFWSPGSFKVELRVTDDRGQIDTDYVTIEVADWVNSPPEASPVATPDSGAAPLPVQFTAHAADPDGDALSYVWDFDDGATSTQADPLHTFTAPGSYLVLLLVSDGDLAALNSVTVTVNPQLDFAVSSLWLKWTGKFFGSSAGQMHLDATLTPGVPPTDAVIALYVDGLELFAAPFGDFHQQRKNGSVYTLKSRYLSVKLDTATGELVVIHQKVNLWKLDRRDGLQVELHVGGAVAVDTVELEPMHDGKRHGHGRHCPQGGAHH